MFNKILEICNSIIEKYQITKNISISISNKQQQKSIDVVISVVLFNTVNMSIVEARKIHGNIIGLKETENQINMYVDRAPHVVELKISLL